MLCGGAFDRAGEEYGMDRVVTPGTCSGMGGWCTKSASARELCSFAPMKQDGRAGHAVAAFLGKHLGASCRYGVRTPHGDVLLLFNVSRFYSLRASHEAAAVLSVAPTRWPKPTKSGPTEPRCERSCGSSFNDAAKKYMKRKTLQ